VRDNLTGLIWLQLANCFSSRNWTTAVSTANSLVSGQCGLADGSVEGDWRLPNVKEMFSVLNFGFPGLKLSNTEGTGQWVEGDPFSDVRSSEYWTSTSLEGSSETYAFSVDTGSGRVEIAPKIDGGLMWPVSGGN
jgi:uncharacterized protein DUF1566